jgi:uncharacterized protein YqgV (UPF0045/DUF77 family)
MRHLTPAIALAALLGLSACADAPGPFGTDVEGYQALDERLEGEAQAQKDVFDAAAAYEPVQIALLNAVRNPDVPADAKEQIKQVDRQVMGALRAYRASVEAKGTPSEARLQAFLAALQQAQQLVSQYGGQR